MPDGKKAKRPLTQQEKDRAVYLHSQSVEDKEIARELGVDARQISGYLRTQINFGKITSPTPKSTSFPESEMPIPPPAPQPPFQPESAQPTPPPVSAAPTPPPPAFAPTPPPPQPSYAPPQPPPTQAAASQDGWVGGRPVLGTVDGFENRAMQVRTVVEREGVGGIYDAIGEHFGSITREQIFDIYGGGTYRILRYEPGKQTPYEFKVRASEGAYGPARTPRRSTAGEQAGGARPGFQRPWNSWRSQAPATGEEDEQRPQARPASPFYNRPDPGLSDFARHGGGSEAAASVEAIKQMGRMNEQIIEQASKARESGPDTFVTQFFHQQQQIWENKLTEEARRRDQERKDEEARWERRQQEMAAEARRRQEDADKQHQRELERIRTEADARERQNDKAQKQLMELEDKKLAVMEREHKNREDLLRDELKRNRDELVSTREAVAAQIAESDSRFQTRFSEHQQALDREHKLKEQHLKIEEQRQNEIIALKREAIQNAGGDQLFQTINTVIKEFSKGLEKIVDLKKIEALTPEAQAAAVAKGTIDGNVMGDPRPKQPEVQPGSQNNAASVQAAASAQQKKDAAGAAANTNAAAQGTSAAGESKSKEQEMEQIIQDMLDKPFFKQVLKEWCLHVKRGENPSTFANMYMEWMRDPMDHEGRKATTMFANFMTPRDWPDMLKIMGPKLDSETLTVFRSEAAVDYYEGFKAMVVEQIRDYWEQFLANRKAQRAAQTAAGEAPAVAPPGGEMPVEKK